MCHLFTSKHHWNWGIYCVKAQNFTFVTLRTSLHYQGIANFWCPEQIDLNFCFLFGIWIKCKQVPLFIPNLHNVYLIWIIPTSSKCASEVFCSIWVNSAEVSSLGLFDPWKKFTNVSLNGQMVMVLLSHWIVVTVWSWLTCQKTKPIYFVLRLAEQGKGLHTQAMQTLACLGAPPSDATAFLFAPAGGNSWNQNPWSFSHTTQRLFCLSLSSMVSHGACYRYLLWTFLLNIAFEWRLHQSIHNPCRRLVLSPFMFHSGLLHNCKMHLCWYNCLPETEILWWSWEELSLMSALSLFQVSPDELWLLAFSSLELAALGPHHHFQHLLSQLAAD